MMLFGHPAVTKMKLYDLQKSKKAFTIHMVIFGSLDKGMFEYLTTGGEEALARMNKCNALFKKILSTMSDMHYYISQLSDTPSQTSEKEFWESSDSDSDGSENNEDINLASVKQAINSKGGAFESKDFRLILDEINNTFPEGDNKKGVIRLTAEIYDNYTLTKIALLRLISNRPKEMEENLAGLPPRLGNSF